MFRLLRPVLAAFLLLAFVQTATAETPPGVAAYDKGDYKTALPLLEKEAATGDPAAQTKLGLIYVKDLGVAHDPAKARALFEKAAAQGDAEAEYCLGVMFDFGDGVPSDAKTAVGWYRKSAEKGYAKAQYNLGSMYYEGLGVEKDRKTAADWYRKAAEQDNADAQFWLARLYLSKDGLEPNMLSAKMWMDRAATKSADAKKAKEIIDKGFANLLQDAKLPPLAGGDGLSEADAISFPDVKNESDGVSAEHRVVATFFQNWNWGTQSLVRGDSGHLYDVIEISKGSEKRSVYFDISNWFGKLE